MTGPDWRVTIDRAARVGWRWSFDDGAILSAGWTLTRRGALAAAARILDARMRRR